MTIPTGDIFFVFSSQCLFCEGSLVFVKNLSELNALIIAHDKDQFNAPEDYSIFSNLNSVRFVNITEADCKKEKMLGGYHGISLTECYANYEKNNKDIIKYLEEIF